jgi:hypothetical protein
MGATGGGNHRTAALIGHVYEPVQRAARAAGRRRLERATRRHRVAMTPMAWTGIGAVITVGAIAAVLTPLEGFSRGRTSRQLWSAAVFGGMAAAICRAHVSISDQFR